jgi:hypothetical protein
VHSTTPACIAVASALLAGVPLTTATAGRPGAGTGAHPTRAASLWPRLETAEPFLLQEIHEKVAGRWRAAWRSLYPPQQRAATEAEYVRCEKSTPLAAPLKTIRVTGVRRSPVQVPGLALPLAGVAVTVHVELEWFGPRDPIVLEHTFHLVPVHGRWRWLLSPDRYLLYLYDGCRGALAQAPRTS